jgi:hypothetical protein
MLGDDDRRREVGGQPLDEPQQRVHSARGGADDDELSVGSLRLDGHACLIHGH